MRSTALTEGYNDGAGDAVGHDHSEDVHHPGVRCSELELIGLVLQRVTREVSNEETKTLKPFRSTHPLDVAAVGGRSSQAQSDHIHEETWDPQQIHGISDEGRGDHVVHEERSVVWEEHAPERSTARPTLGLKDFNRTTRICEYGVHLG